MKWTGEYSPFQQLVHDVEAMKAHIKYLCVAQIEKDNGKDSLPSDTLAYPPFTLTLLLSPLFFLLFSSFSFFFFFCLIKFSYGMKHYNFYKCSKCESMYCGGKRECGDVEPVCILLVSPLFFLLLLFLSSSSSSELIDIKGGGECVLVWRMQGMP